jgi:hypothetical protein
MRRALPLAALLASVLLLLTGCGAGADGTAAPVTVKASPQTAKLGWVEPYPAEKPALVFGVSSFTVTDTGWSADISVENTSDIGWEIGDPRHEADLAFGVMLFPNDDVSELERRNRSGDLPAIREATSYEPTLPNVLRPGKTWKGVISAPGALAGGLWVRISFGTFVSVGEPPKGVNPSVQWFTDHAYHLDEVAVSAQPA